MNLRPSTPRSPILIGGASRSGETLLRWMLVSHPAIAVSRRTELWPRFFGRFGDLSEPENLERCLASSAHSWAGWQVRRLLPRREAGPTHPPPAAATGGRR